MEQCDLTRFMSFRLLFFASKKSQLPILTTKNEVMLLCILVGIELHHKACHKRAANSKIHMDEDAIRTIC